MLIAHKSDFKQVLNGLSHLNQLVGGDGHFLSLGLGNCQAVYDAPVLVLDGDWETVEKSFRDLVFVAI